MKKIPQPTPLFTMKSGLLPRLRPASTLLLLLTLAVSCSGSEPRAVASPQSEEALAAIPAPVREEAVSRYHPRRPDSGRVLAGPRAKPLRLALKHYPREGAQPVLLVHGLSQNDRGLDASVPKYSFARYLWQQGFDVWVGNMRNAGTPGFESDTPPGPRHWTVDDYAIDDLPALILRVRESTGVAPFVIGHSLAGWALDGWMAGVEYEPKTGRVRENRRVARERASIVRGIVTVAGVYGLWWEKRLADARVSPVRSVDDYYRSNYELELLAQADPLYKILPKLPGMPLGWVGSVVNLPLDRIPYVGESLRRLYQGFADSAIESPVFSMLYYPPNVDPEMVRLHVEDGMEDLGPKLVEQLANAYACGKRLSFHDHAEGCKAPGAYVYDGLRRADETGESLGIPMLMVAGGRDRMASAAMIERDGYRQAKKSGRVKDLEFLRVEEFGHLDILSGRNAPAEVFAPVAAWMKARL